MQRGVGFFTCLLSLILIVSTFTMTPLAVSAALSGISVEPSNNIFNIESFYVVTFTTGTTGTIKTIDIAFPSGFILTNTKIIEISGISAGTLSIAGQTLTYTVATPVSVPSGSKIQVMFGKIVNNFGTPNNLTISTKDPSSVVIDGPTVSPGFLLKGIGTGMIVNGAITNTKIANNSINGTQIKSGAITKANIAAGSGIVTGAQSCLGKVVAGFDASGNVICKSISFVRDSIKTLDSAGDVGAYTSVAIGTDGFPIISYYDSINGDLKLVHCTSISCSNQDTPSTLDSTGAVGTYTSIAIGIDGFPVISYYDLTNADLKAVHCTNTSCNAHDLPVTIDSLGSVGGYTSIKIGTDGFPFISYYDQTNGDLKAVHCASVSCIAYTKLTLDSTGDVGAYTSVAIGTDGFPIISYYDSTNTNLKIVHCTSVTCFSQDNPIALDIGGVGLFTSIAIGTDNFPVISYENNFGYVRVIHCTDTSCSTHGLPKIFNDKPTSSSTFIAIAADGFPIISYSGGPLSNLKVIQCTSVSCSTDDIPETLDNDVSTGAYSSIAIIKNSFPVISSYDATNGDLKTVLMGGIVLS